MSEEPNAGVSSYSSRPLTTMRLLASPIDPSIPLTFEGTWDYGLEKHVFQSSQPYQERNIDDPGLGARFYGLRIWQLFVAHFVGKPYIIGMVSADADLYPGNLWQTPLNKYRFYFAQEMLDLGDVFGNFMAHLTTADFPQVQRTTTIQFHT